MKRIFLITIAIFFPWLAFLLMDEPIKAGLALILQITLIGWIPASAWAINVANSNNKKQ